MNGCVIIMYRGLSTKILKMSKDNKLLEAFTDHCCVSNQTNKNEKKRRRGRGTWNRQEIYDNVLELRENKQKNIDCDYVHIYALLHGNRARQREREAGERE